MNKTGRVFCAALKQFAPLRARSIKAWNQRRGRDAAQRSHGSQGAPWDVTGQKTLHQGLPFLHLFPSHSLILSGNHWTPLPHDFFFSPLSPPTLLLRLCRLPLAYFFRLHLCLPLYKFSSFILPSLSSSPASSSALPKRITCICNILRCKLDLLFGPVCLCVYGCGHVLFHISYPKTPWDLSCVRVLWYSEC